MPELPEVETIVRGLAGQVVGRRVERVELARGDIVHGHPAPLCALIHRRCTETVDRHGKWIRLAMEGPTRLEIHLGMSGRLVWVPEDSPVEAHTHLRLGFRRCRKELRFIDPRRFGGVWLTHGNGDACDAWIGAVRVTPGPDALLLKAKSFQQILKRRRQIKALLLDQGAIAGLGNIYCDEILHRAGIHPLTRASDLTLEQGRTLHRALRQVLLHAIRAGGSSIRDYRDASNMAGSFQNRHRVYQREGLPCGRCRTPITHMQAAGRSTFYCPACQPPPASFQESLK